MKAHQNGKGTKMVLQGKKERKAGKREERRGSWEREGRRGREG